MGLSSDRRDSVDCSTYAEENKIVCVYKIVEGVRKMASITVVIPCYNASSHLLKCIQALNAQNNKDFEVTFVDDASTDNTVEVINNLKSNVNFDYSLISCKKNEGPANARNIAIKKTTTEFITFCDSDDWYDETYIESMYRGLKKNNIDIVFCGYKVVNEKGDAEEKKIIEQSAVLGIEEALTSDVDSLCMMMVKTSIMKKHLLPDIRNGEDMAVVPLLLIEANQCLFLEACLYNYFRRSDSASQTISMNVVKSFGKSFDFIFERAGQYKNEIEYIGIRNLIYASLISLFSISYDKKIANEIISGFETRFPDWEKNQYLLNLPLYKKVVVKLAKHKLYFGIYILAIVRKKLIS